jgi:uncharacterized iron-regulated membrane protein
MPISPNAFQLIRKVHRYFGIFISPMILFFAFTGAIQTLSLHESSQGSSYTPAKWEAVLAQIHKNQTDVIPVRKAKPASDKPTGDKPKPAPDATAAPVAPAPPLTPLPTGKWHQHLPMKIFFLLVALGLITSTLTGITMAYRYSRSAWVVSAVLLAGVVVPLVLLKF